MVPINWRLTKGEVEHILQDSGAQLVFFEREFEHTVASLRPDLLDTVRMDDRQHRASGFLAWKDGHPDHDLDLPTGVDDPMLQMYTSGTT